MAAETRRSKTITCSYLAVMIALSLGAPETVLGEPLTTSDDAFRFTLTLPEGWVVRQAPDAESFLRLAAVSPDATAAIRVYAVRAAGDVDLQKLARVEERIDVLGHASSSRELRWIPWLLQPYAIEKTFTPSATGVPATARFSTHGTYGYVIAVHSASLRDSEVEELFEGFDTTATMGANLMNKWRGIRERGILRSFGGWIGGILLAVLAVAVLYLLGKSGAQIRQGVRINAVLRRSLREASAQGLRPSAKYYEFRGKAWRKILIPVALWTFAYLVLFGLASREIFLGSLLLLAVPLLGFFGFFFGLSDDPADYV